MEYIQGSIKRKVQVAILICALVLYSLVINIDWFTQLGRSVVLISNIFMFVLLLYTALYSWKFAVNVYKSQQYPPPDAEMPFTIKIVKGSKAKVQAYSSFSIAILLIIFSFYKYGFGIYNNL